MKKLGHVEIVERRAKNKISEREHYAVRVVKPDGNTVELFLTALEFYNASERAHFLGPFVVDYANVD